VGPWHAACGALFIIMGVGNFRATCTTYLIKRKVAKGKKKEA
jgi:hypothetical protein